MEFVNGLGLLALGSRLRALSERLYALADEVYAKHGISMQGRWFPALRLLHDRGPSTVGEIAEAIGQTHSAVSQMADKLAREGWLVSTPDAKDRRVRRVALSARAHAALRDAKPAWRAIEEVLAQRSAAAGIDVLGSLEQLAGILDDSLGEAIVARTTALRRSAVRVVPFSPAMRDHFYTLNAAWLVKYFYIEAIDERVLRNPETELLANGGAICVPERRASSRACTAWEISMAMLSSRKATKNRRNNALRERARHSRRRRPHHGSAGLPRKLSRSRTSGDSDRQGAVPPARRIS